MDQNHSSCQLDDPGRIWLLKLYREQSCAARVLNAHAGWYFEADCEAVAYPVGAWRLGWVIPGRSCAPSAVADRVVASFCGQDSVVGALWLFGLAGVPRGGRLVAVRGVPRAAAYLTSRSGCRLRGLLSRDHFRPTPGYVQ